jgi:hypothetical protein
LLQISVRAFLLHRLSRFTPLLTGGMHGLEPGDVPFLNGLL